MFELNLQKVLFTAKISDDNRIDICLYLTFGYEEYVLWNYVGLHWLCVL